MQILNTIKKYFYPQQPTTCRLNFLHAYRFCLDVHNLGDKFCLVHGHIIHPILGKIPNAWVIHSTYVYEWPDANSVRYQFQNYYFPHVSAVYCSQNDICNNAFQFGHSGPWIK